MIRPSGGRAVVKVRKMRAPGAPAGSIREYLGRRWRWEVPVPKGAARTPAFWSLRGSAASQQEALAAGLARLAEVYGPQSDYALAGPSKGGA